MLLRFAPFRCPTGVLEVATIAQRLRDRTVKGILLAGTEHGDDPPGQHSDPPPAMLRGPDAFGTERSA